MEEEKRRHVRYPAVEEAVMLGAAFPGRILDVSRGGVAVTYPGCEDLGEELEIDLLHTAKNILIEKIRCRKVSDLTVGKVRMFSYVAQRRLGLQFVDPPLEALSLIGHFAAEETPS